MSEIRDFPRPFKMQLDSHPFLQLFHPALVHLRFVPGPHSSFDLVVISSSLA